MRGVGASMLGAWVAVQRQYVGSLSGGVCLGHVFHILHMVGLGWWCGRALGGLGGGTMARWWV